MKNKTLVLPLAALMLAASAVGGVVSVAYADTSSTATATTGTSAMRERPAAMGKVTAVSGSTITITDDRASTTYTVDASGATVTKHAAPATEGAAPTETTISVSDIAVGDMIAVRGTVSGSNIVATAVEDGMMGHGFGHKGPGVHGTVSAVNGTTLTVTGEDGKTYTVDAASATASKMVTINVSDIAVGDSIGVDGTVSGTTVTAKHVMDGLMKPATQTDN